MIDTWTCKHGVMQFHEPNGTCVCEQAIQTPGEQSRWVRLVRLLRKPEDKGVGDTVQRIAAKFGGERFKAWSKRIGMPCGCTERQKAWNERWPY